jgi:hypothetical protein
MDIEGALREVANSNASKFVENREPIFNAQTKIMKGPRYQPPELDQYAVRRCGYAGTNDALCGRPTINAPARRPSRRP